ncbi:TetR/AcrR family transcriptional regulator [Arthrobacter sp. NPDC056727]|uniref:TetR/AcrR family transcriptional regulator n=1 Tax=Arthrobacter sp. NPDC056727 TaxID=3345927 RepID=UPI00366EB7FB
MDDANQGSPRRRELLEAAYQEVLTRGLSDLSLRPLAERIGSSPRVLLFLFTSKDGLVRAVLERARADEERALDEIQASGASLSTTAHALWKYLSAPEHRALLRLWIEAFTKSTTQPQGPWNDFAAASTRRWLDLFTAAQPPESRPTPEAEIQRTAVTAIIRGAMLDLLATGDAERTTAAVSSGLSGLNATSPA